jgi:hypothetical protein
VAPEQARGEGLDARADQFSLAALTYLLLAGRAPYDHSSLTAAADPAPAAPMGGGLPDAVEAVVHRGLAADREERYPDVPAYLAALSAAVGAAGDDSFDGADEAPAAWIPPDAGLTQVSSERSTASGSTAIPVDPRARRRWALVGVAALVLGSVGGYAMERRSTTEQTVRDASKRISVTVPEPWTEAVDTQGWRPPESSSRSPGLSAGTRKGWNGTDEPGHGVFLGLMTGQDLPSRVPWHPECAEAGRRIDDTVNGDQSLTVLFTGCPLEGRDDGVTVERVVQTTANQLLWVQVRAADSDSANDVLESVAVTGF